MLILPLPMADVCNSTADPENSCGTVWGSREGQDPWSVPWVLSAPQRLGLAVNSLLSGRAISASSMRRLLVEKHLDLRACLCQADLPSL